MHMTDTCPTEMDEVAVASKRILDVYQDLESRINHVHHQLATIEKTRAHELQENQQLNDKLGVLFDILPVGIIVLNNQGMIEQANREAELILGTELLNKSWSAVICHAFAPREDDGLEVSLVNGKRISVKTSTLEQDQSQLIILNDLTETRKLLDEANHQQRLADLGSMMASLAHQIRTPLASATLYLGHMNNKNITSEKLQDYGSRSLERLHVVNRMIEDMLLFVKGQKRAAECLPLSELFTDLERSLDEEVRSERIALKLELNDQTVLVRINKPAMVGAILNCVINSIEAASESEVETVEITVATRCVNALWVEISISDNGPGIETAALTQVFNAFYTSKPRGTGLGLAVVKSVVESHQGKLEIQSQVNQGTKVLIHLPIEKGAADA